MTNPPPPNNQKWTVWVKRFHHADASQTMSTAIQRTAHALQIAKDRGYEIVQEPQYITEPDGKVVGTFQFIKKDHVDGKS